MERQPLRLEKIHGYFGQERYEQLTSALLVLTREGEITREQEDDLYERLASEEAAVREAAASQIGALMTIRNRKSPLHAVLYNPDGTPKEDPYTQTAEHSPGETHLFFGRLKRILRSGS